MCQDTAQASPDLVPLQRGPSLELLRARLSQLRKRPLILVATPVRLPGAVVLVDMPEADLVVYESGLPAPCQAYAVAHQAGHMFLRHRGMPVRAEATAALFPHLDPHALSARFGELEVFTAVEEQEAEQFAALFAATGLPPSARGGSCLRIVRHALP